MSASMKAKYLSNRLRKETESLSALAERLESGALPEDRLPDALRAVERELRLLSKTAETRAYAF